MIRFRFLFLLALMISLFSVIIVSGVDNLPVLGNSNRVIVNIINQTVYPNATFINNINYTNVCLTNQTGCNRTLIYPSSGTFLVDPTDDIFYSDGTTKLVDNGFGSQSIYYGNAVILSDGAGFLYLGTTGSKSIPALTMFNDSDTGIWGGSNAINFATGGQDVLTLNSGANGVFSNNVTASNVFGTNLCYANGSNCQATGGGGSSGWDNSTNGIINSLNNATVNVTSALNVEGIFRMFANSAGSGGSDNQAKAGGYFAGGKCYYYGSNDNSFNYGTSFCFDYNVGANSNDESSLNISIANGAGYVQRIFVDKFGTGFNGLPVSGTAVAIGNARSKLYFSDQAAGNGTAIIFNSPDSNYLFGMQVINPSSGVGGLAFGTFTSVLNNMSGKNIVIWNSTVEFPRGLNSSENIISAKSIIGLNVNGGNICYTDGTNCSTGNSTFNQTLTDSLYYPRNNNPNGYLNTTTSDGNNYTISIAITNSSRTSYRLNETRNGAISLIADFLIIPNWNDIISIPSLLYGLDGANNNRGFLLSNGTHIGYNESILNQTIRDVGLLAGFNSSATGDGNNYTWRISFNQNLTNKTLYLERIGAENLTAEFVDLDTWLTNYTNYYTKSQVDTNFTLFVPRGTADAWIIKYQNISNIPTCSVGTSLFYNGSVLNCSADAGTAYTAGAGLILTGNQFNLTDSYLGILANVSYVNNMSFTNASYYLASNPSVFLNNTFNQTYEDRKINVSYLNNTDPFTVAQTFNANVSVNQSNSYRLLNSTGDVIYYKTWNGSCVIEVVRGTLREATC